MYNKKSKISAILTIVAAVLVVSFMVLLPTLIANTEMNLGDIFALVIVGSIYGFLPLYASSIPFIIVALTFGAKMLKEQSRKKLISLNARMLITTCVLAPFFGLGLTFVTILTQKPVGVVIVICAVVTALAYVAALVAQIVAIVMLKKSPEESENAEAVEPNATKQ